MSVNITCHRCKMVFGMPNDFYNSMVQLADKGTFYCPAGHTQCFRRGETEEQRLQRELDRARQNIAYYQDVANGERQAKEELERKNSAQRGVFTRMKNRAAAGVCPCCSRSFGNLRSHMKTKHPDFAKKEEAA